MANRHQDMDSSRRTAATNEENAANDEERELRADTERGERGAREGARKTGDTVRETARAVQEAAARESILPDLGTAAVVGVAVAAIETELLPGVLIGAGAILARRLLPVVGLILRPVVKSAVKAGYGVYSATRGVVAEASEQVDDMIAEARTEQRGAASRAQEVAPG